MSDVSSESDNSAQVSVGSVSSERYSSSDSDEYKFEDNFLPYQDEPSSDDQTEELSDEELDEDLSWSNDTKNKSHFNSGKDFIFFW